jgi:hypothetical protein
MLIKSQPLGIFRDTARDKQVPEGCELVAAVLKRALADARGNDPVERVDAVHFLDIAVPDWRSRQRGRR